MVFEFAYQVIRDLASLAKMEDAEPLDPGTLDAHGLVKMGLINAEGVEACSWSAPRKLFAGTQAPDASLELVWVTDKLRRTKRRVVRYTHDGNL